MISGLASAIFNGATRNPDGAGLAGRDWGADQMQAMLEYLGIWAAFFKGKFDIKKATSVRLRLWRR